MRYLRTQTLLGTVVNELDDHAEAQVMHRSAAVQGTTGKTAVREDLREQLEAINRTARAMSLDTPGLEDRFRLPRGNNDQALISTARAFHASAEPLKADFVKNELPATFLDDLQATITRFEGALAGRNTSREARVAATSAISSAIERGIGLVRQLDAIVRNKFRDDAATIAAWESASRTERTPHKAQKHAAQPPPQ
ncbi:MAG: hypothetical protein QOF61_3442 [Acidobacteriota bacterium]|jgi:hypothetical protein|nr:hypothetical protein [Acidobacteriota bacterium]